jgi:hypothetical protein
MLNLRLSILALIMATVTCSAQQANNGIAVSLHDNALQVEIKRPTSVSAALMAVCAVAAASCDLSALPASKEVAPLRISGSWEEVVGHLLDGTGFDYVAMGASGAFKPRLVVTVANLSPSPVSPPVSPVEPRVTTASPESAFDSPASTVVQAPAAGIGDQSPTLSEPEAAPSADYSASSAVPDGMNEVPFAGPGGSIFVPKADPNGPVQMPFAGPEGMISVPRAPAGARYLPWPDANGNPVPAPPQSNDIHMIVPSPNGYQEIVSPGPH